VAAGVEGQSKGAEGRNMNAPSTEAGRRTLRDIESQRWCSHGEPIETCDEHAALPEPSLDVAQVRRAISSHREAMDDQRQKYHCGPASCVHDIYARLVPSAREAEPEARE
jgi:hypothetical protein